MKIKVHGSPLLAALSVVFVTVLLMSCTTTSSSSVYSTYGPTPQKKDQPDPGFFSRAWDQMTERECLTTKFSCPYGWGPPGEPCDCTDPSGRVWFGKTIK